MAVAVTEKKRRPRPPGRDTMRAGEVGELLGVAASTVRQWAALGKIPRPRRPSRRSVFWSRAAIEQFIQQKETGR